MPTTTNPPRFIPLSQGSQNSHENILFYDNQASLKAILECANVRLEAATNLLDIMREYKNLDDDAVIAICIVSKLLLSDTNIIVSAYKARQ